MLIADIVFLETYIACGKWWITNLYLHTNIYCLRQMAFGDYFYLPTYIAYGKWWLLILFLSTNIYYLRQIPDADIDFAE